MLVLAVVFQVAVAIASVALIVGLRRSRRGTSGSVHGIAEAAFLGGGPGRLADTTITGMHTDGRLSIAEPGVFAVEQPVARNPLEQALLDEHAMAPSGSLYRLRTALMHNGAVQEVGDGLARRGLLVTPAESRRWLRRSRILGFGCLIPLPVAFFYAGASHSESDGVVVPPADGIPVDFLLVAALAVGSVIGLGCARFAKRRITAAGRKARNAFAAKLSRYPEPSELVAAHGVRGVPDQALKVQLRAASWPRPDQGSNDGGGGSSARGGRLVRERTEHHGRLRGLRMRCG